MALLDFSSRKWLKIPLLTLILVAVYLIVAIPFKVMEIIPGFTDIRPVMLLEPAYGVFFGIPGCLAFAVGNLIGDIFGDDLRWSSIAGFVANFLGPFCFWLYWTKLSKEPFRLRNRKNILKHCAVIVVSALLQTIVITPTVKLFYPEVSGFLFALTVMLNGMVFPIVIGVPLMILMQEELGFQPAGRRSITS